jgi:hypothetical protein
MFPNKDDWKRSDFYDCLGAFWAVKWGLHWPPTICQEDTTGHWIILVYSLHSCIKSDALKEDYSHHMQCASYELPRKTREKDIILSTLKGIIDPAFFDSSWFEYWWNMQPHWSLRIP